MVKFKFEKSGQLPTQFSFPLQESSKLLALQTQQTCTKIFTQQLKDECERFSQLISEQVEGICFIDMSHASVSILSVGFDL